MSKREAPAIEPPTDTPAMRDPHTEHAYATLRRPLIGLPAAAGVMGAAAVVSALTGAGWVLVALFTIIGLAFAASAVFTLAMLGPWIGPAGRLLNADPWRPASVTVYRPGRGVPKARLRVRDGDSVIDLIATGVSWPAQQVLARTGRIWLVGPDARGFAAIRSTGLALTLGQARVTRQDVSDGFEVNVEQDAPVAVSPAASDAVLTQATAVPRRRARTDLIMPVVLVAFAVFMAADLVKRGVGNYPLLSLGVGAGVAVAAGYLWWRIGRLRFWLTVDKLLASGPWRSVDATVADGAVTATIGGRAVAVRFRQDARELRANIEATGRLWLAGPTDGAVAVGLPGYPFLAVADLT